MAADKKLIAIRASELTRRQLAELCQVLGMNQSEMLVLAIDRLYQAEIVDRNKNEHPSQTGEGV